MDYKIRTILPGWLENILNFFFRRIRPKWLENILNFFFGIVVLGEAGAGRAFFTSGDQMAKDWLEKINSNREEALLQLKAFAQSSPDQVRGLLHSVQSELPKGFYDEVFQGDSYRSVSSMNPDGSV